MAELVDILAPKLASCPEFVVNTAVDFVAISLPVAVDYYARDYADHYIFLKGDSFILLTAGIMIPEMFSLYKAGGGKQLPSLYIKIINIAGQEFSNPLFSSSYTFLPDINLITVFNTFCDCFDCKKIADPAISLLDENYILQVLPQDMFAISMINVPAAMNGKTFKVVPFVKVVHTKLLG